MKSKIRFFASFKTLALLLFILSCLLLADNFKQTDAGIRNDNKTTQDLLSPTKEEGKTTRELVKKLKKSHYLDEPIDDAFSEKVFNGYLKILDFARAHFLASDIEEFSKYRHTFDDDMKSGNLKPAFFIYNRYHERRQQRLNYMLELLDRGIGFFDFQKDESLELDRENLPWLADMGAAKDLWRRLLKNEILNLKLGDTPDYEILKNLKKRYRNQLHILEQINSSDVFDSFITVMILIPIICRQRSRTILISTCACHWKESVRCFRVKICT